MLLLDVTIVNVALPSIERDLGATFSDLQWVIDAYALTLAGLLLAAGVAGRQGRPQARLHARAGDLHRFVVGLWTGSRAALPASLARGAGERRGDDVRHLAGADRAGVPGSRAWDRSWHLRRDHGRGGLDRAARRRCTRGRVAVAAVGSVAGYALVRSRDFVASGGPAAPPEPA